jgi:hypothetical protein
MKRILLIGKDPVFAWALEKTIGPLGYHIEHTYTLVEAKLRMSRFEYSLILLDGLSKTETDTLLETQETSCTVFIFDGVSPEKPEIEKNCKTFVVPKEHALASILASLQNPPTLPQTA